MNVKRNCIVVFLVSEQLKSYEGVNTTLVAQKEHLSLYMQQHPELQLLQDFYQIIKKQKNKNKWSQISEAFSLCENNGYTLIIPELKQHYGHTGLGLLFNATFHEKSSLDSLICLDHPEVNAQNINSFINQLQKRREKHGQLIKQGLTRSVLKSGNPRASEIIRRVNRPKILFSILFSILIEPVVSVMEELQLSQRKMVDYLNTNTFYAPEGGRWVLSQFQKVYDRLKMNRLALAVKHKIESTEIMSTLINDLNLVAKHLLPKNKIWTSDLVHQVRERLEDLKELFFMLQAKSALEDCLQQRVSDDLTYNDLMNNSAVDSILSKLKQDQLIKSA